MKFKNVIQSVLVGIFCGYLGIWIQKQIEKRLGQPETPDLRGGEGDRVGFLFKLLENHTSNVPYVLGILGTVVSTATIQ